MPRVYSLVFSKIADDDVVSIWRYGRETWGADKANNYIDGLEGVLEDVCRFPEMGVQFQGGGLNLRCVYFRQHVIYYEVMLHKIVVMAILHKHADKNSILQRRLLI